MVLVFAHFSLVNTPTIASLKVQTLMVLNRAGKTCRLPALGRFMCQYDFILTDLGCDLNLKIWYHPLPIPGNCNVE